MKKLKILLVHNYEIKNGGVSVLNYDFAEFLSQKDWRVTIFSPLAKSYQGKKSFNLEWRFKNLEKLVFKSDTILINLSPYLWGSYSKTLEICQKYKKSYIIWFHIIFDREVYKKRFGFKIFKEKENKLREIFNSPFCSKIICVSEASKNFIDYLVEDNKKIIVIYPGVKKFKSNSQLDISGDVLYVGRLSEEKNVEILIKAIKEIKDYNLNIVGSGPEKEKLEKLVNKLGLVKMVKFYSCLSREQIFGLYQSHKILCLPSKIESFGLVIVEAMFNELPVVVSKNYGAMEILKDFDYKLFFKVNDKNELKNKIKLALKNLNYFKNEIKKIKKILERKFNFERQMGLIEKNILESKLLKN
jgi:glycosyltransferase involved in cell wall biosynthesis